MGFFNNLFTPDEGNDDIIEGITCTAVNCIYNGQNNRCEADHIYVGNEFSHSTAETSCTTFTPRQH